MAIRSSISCDGCNKSSLVHTGVGKGLGFGAGFGLGARAIFEGDVISTTTFLRGTGAVGLAVLGLEDSASLAGLGLGGAFACFVCSGPSLLAGLGILLYNRIG